EEKLQPRRMALLLGRHAGGRHGFIDCHVGILERRVRIRARPPMSWTDAAIISDRITRTHLVFPREQPSADNPLVAAVPGGSMSRARGRPPAPVRGALLARSIPMPFRLVLVLASALLALTAAAQDTPSTFGSFDRKDPKFDDLIPQDAK